MRMTCMGPARAGRRSALGSLGEGEEVVPAGLDESLTPVGAEMLIIDRVTLAPRWRGYGLGSLVAGMVIECLGESRRLAALVAGPVEYRDDKGNGVDRLSESGWNAAVRKLGELWAQ